MENAIIEIVVSDAGERRASGKLIYVDSSHVVEEIESLGFPEETQLLRGSRKRRVVVLAPENDSRMPDVMRILTGYGFAHYPHHFQRREHASKEFVIRRKRSYTREEICQAELLRLAGAQRKFAEFAPDSSGEVYVVEVSQHLKSKIDFGRSYYHVSVLMSERLKTALEEDGLTATNFKEASYVRPPKPGIKRLWQFGSTVRMPVCKTLRQDTHGGFVSKDGPPVGSLGYYWDDAGYQPAELVYSRSEVEHLPRFDIAMTREFVGEPFAPYREIIVTQRFREAMEKHGVKTAEWAPVRLV